ncbi:PREDICTED: eIF-2-alpha kinase activator GCN1 isoform X21 [Ipomoea nil]|uniref:eIF-2-alpha kinase activator GCN1 isoform X21 n=1 Tax=Ipomoea nil TaxID=35883 RepID=UPI000900FF7C|nr:PREDICTED: eIF-2-alpha kinase activator GCN1 isoform X21 [Ipomoea nil]
MANPVESLASIDSSVPTSSTKRRVQIFRDEIPSILSGSEMTTEMASVLVDLIFKTLFVYDDRGSVKAVDDVVIKSLRQVAFMKSFAATLVQVMEKNLKFQSHIGCHRLLKWSCLLLTESEFSSASKNAFCRVAQVQASILHIGMQGSLRVRRACKQTFFFLFSKLPDIYGSYMEELRDSRISYKDCPEIVLLMLEYSTLNPSLFEKWKQVFLDMYTKVVLNAREKPPRGLSEAFFPLFTHLSHEDFKSTVIPLSVKMLKRNPELVLESVAILLQSANLDLSKYAVEMLAVVLTQARHTDEGRKTTALSIIRCLSTKSSSPDALEEMFKAVKSVIGGSEGRLTFPYQRVGMINALQEMSNAPEGKYLTSLSKTICSFLLSCYKDDGNEEVKLAILSCFASWAARCADAIDQGVVSFISNGLKEKETLRKGHLRCVRLICKNIDAVPRISSLLAPLLQLVKTGFTKVAQRLDGIYALFCVAKIAAIDVKADETVMKEKIWALISQNEPSLVPITMASKLPIEDCMACHDLFEALLIDHPQRMLETFPVSTFVQFILFVLCHPSWAVRRAAYNSVKKIIAAIPQLSEAIMLEFSNYLSAVGEKVLLKTSDTDSLSDNQVPVLPSVEVLVKALVVLSPATLSAVPHVCKQILFCSHNPCLIGSAKRNAVWRRVHKCLQRQGFDVVHLLSTDVAGLCQGLLGSRGLMSQNHFEQEAAINSFSTLMSIIPGETYTEFVKNFNDLPDRHAHDMFSENDIQAFSCLCYFIQIFRTPEGMLSTEQGVYIAESISSKNTKQPKGRFRVYDSNDDLDKGNSNRLQRHELSSKDATVVGKKDGGKSTKKSDKDKDKGKTAKEEARDMQLREEACIRERVMVVQNNLSSMLKALGEMAIANHVFTHSQLPYLADPNVDVRGRMINAGILIIDKHGNDNVSLLFPIFENYLNKKASDEEKYDLVREGVVIFTGALAKHLAKDDPKVHAVVEKLLDVLNTPSEAVQRAVSSCLSPLMQSKQEDAPALVSRLLDKLMKSDKYGERRGAAFGLGGVVKGFKISCIKKYGIITTLREGFLDRNSAKCREGALLAFECFCETLGKLFEPYVIQMLPLLLVSFSDQVVAVREAAECAARAMMSQLTAQGVKLILPSLLKGLEDKAWRTKQSSVQLLGAMAYCAPQQLSQCLPKIVPKLTEVLTDTHPKVQSAGQTALQQVGSVIKNPEISALVPTLLMGLTEPNEHTKYSLDILLQTTFINTIDAPSLALLVPIVHRGLRERSAETKKKAAQIVGNMCSLVTEPKDMIPYIGLLLPEVKKVLLDPIPEVRSVAARAIGSLIRGMGEENFPDLVPWLLDTLKSDGSNVERSGAAQGLSEVLAALGLEYFETILPDIIRNCSHQKASVRDGYLTLFRYLPRSLGVQFQNYLQQVLPAIIDGLADENESVRDAALGAGHVLVEHYATTSLPLLLPAVEEGIFNDNWRIRQSSVELLGDLLFKVAGTSGKAHLEGGSDDEGSSTEAHGRAIIEVLGREKRNEVLAAVYMVRTDVSITVRQAALHVWKTIVANTPKTLREIMPVLMSTLISSLASSSSERRQVAGRALGELVRKLGERVLPLIIPILSKGLNDPNPSRRQGVCIGLSEVMASAGKNQLLSFMDKLIPTIRTALCDSMPEVRESAGLAFSTLYKTAGMQAIDEIVPTLLHALEDDQTSDTALDGLKQILSVRTSAVLPHILPKLVHLPLSAFNAHALGALAEVAGTGLDAHLGTILPALLTAMGYTDMEVQSLAKKAAETVVTVIDEEGIESLLSELLKGVGDSQASIRQSSAYLIGYLFKTSDLYLVDEAPNLISTLIILLSDSDSATVTVAWEALSSVIRSVPKEVLPSYIKLVRDAVSTSRDKERRKKKGGPVLIPGFCLRKALQPVLPIFLQGLISGSAELREQAALGLGELIEVTSEQALKEFVIPITGPLIRIIGDRFPWQVKSAILSTLSIIIRKGGLALKPFLPQLQTTFVKCLQDNTRTVRSSAALALGKLSALTTRIDPLVGDLLSALQQASDVGIREAILTALKGVIKHAGKSVSSASRTRVYTLLKDLIYNDDDQIRICAASILGIISQYLEDEEVLDLLNEITNSASSSTWCTRHGAVLTISSMLKHSPAIICTSSSYGAVVNCLKSSLKDEKFPIRETSTRAFGRLLCHQIQSDSSNASSHLEILGSIVSAMQDDSSEVRRRALSSLKIAAKSNPSDVMIHVSKYGPVLAECMKDASTPVRVAAERCALHAFQLTKSADNVQAAQKFITGLDARRIAKLPEYSDVSEDSDIDTSSG